MVARVSTVAFEGIEARAVDVQVQVAPGLPAFAIVGLPGQGGFRGARAGALGADRLGAGAAGAADHRQPRAGRSAQGRQPLRSADRARPDGGDRRDPAGRAQRLYRARRTRARWLDRARGRRLAGRDRRQCARGRPDLSGGVRNGSRLGEPRYPDHRGKIADPDRQPFQRHAGAVAPAAESARAGGDASRFARHQGPGERKTRAGNRRGRRASSADDRLARRGQIDAGGAAAVDPAAAVAVRTAGSLDDRLRRRRNPRRRLDRAAAVPQPRIIPPAWRR